MKYDFEQIQRRAQHSASWILKHNNLAHEKQTKKLCWVASFGLAETYYMLMNSYDGNSSLKSNKIKMK